MIGVQLFTVREQCKTPEELKKTIMKLYEIGYRSFELARIQFSLEEMIVLKEMKENLGIVYSTSQIKLKVIQKDFDWLMTFSKELGIKSIEVSVIPIRAFLGMKKGLLELAQTLNELGQKTLEHGVSLLYHHHNFELIKIGSELGIEILFSSTDKKYVNYVVDTYWLSRSGINPYSFITQYEARIRGLHLRDCQFYFKRLAFRYRDCAVGDGVIDFGFLKEMKPTWFYSVEQATDTPFEALQKSFNYIMAIK